LGKAASARRKKSFGLAGSIAEILADADKHLPISGGSQDFRPLGELASGVVDCIARRDSLPQRRGSESFETWFEGQQFVVTFSCFQDGRLAEVFVNAIKSATLFDHLARDTGLLISLALQHGASADRLAIAVSRDSEERPQGLAGHVLDIVGRGGGHKLVEADTSAAASRGSILERGDHERR
jgi:ribonucleoside-diphosphate reductase alpha chain